MDNEKRLRNYQGIETQLGGEPKLLSPTDECLLVLRNERGQMEGDAVIVTYDKVVGRKNITHILVDKAKGVTYKVPQEELGREFLVFPLMDPSKKETSQSVMVRDSN